jgi:hypothetical protein
MKLLLALLIVAVCCFASSVARSDELLLPASVDAAAGLSIPTTGDGEATFYLFGPASAIKRKVKLGSAIQLLPTEIEQAGRYIAVLHMGDRNIGKAFWVMPSKPAKLGLIVRPSRLPVALEKAISGVAYVFDNQQNIIVEPQSVKFEFAVPGVDSWSQTLTSQYGAAAIRVDSSRRQGTAQFTASVGDVFEKRVVQLVASDPCNLRIQATRVKDRIEVKTDAIRDCTGNAVPDGTIVTFSAIGPEGKSTVDARIKRGFAEASFPRTGQAVISVASGVVLGNEIRVSGGSMGTDSMASGNISSENMGAATGVGR